MVSILFVPKREEVVGGCRNLYNEELHNLTAYPNIIRVIKSKRMGAVGHVTRMGEVRNSYEILVENREGKRTFGIFGIVRKMILECILGKQCGKLWTGCICLRIGASGILL
jgi:hypothetical protein